MNERGIFPVAAALALALTAGGAGAQSAPDQAAPHAPVVDREGRQIGTAVAEPTPNGMIISIAVHGLPPGEHGFHLHETGSCDAAGGFSSAGGHYAARGQEHGFRVEGGPHAGDMPNQFVDQAGNLRAHVFNPRVTLDGGEAPLRDHDGTALVVHAGTDDYRSQPSGDAGDRLACAVLAPPRN